MQRLRLLLTAALLCTLAACGSPSSTESPTAEPTAAPTRTPRPTLAPASPTLEPTVAPTAMPVATFTAELSATAAAGLPPTPTADSASGTGGFGLEGVSAQPLEVPAGWPPLWAVSSRGMSVGEPSQAHFVAIYTHDGGEWKEVDRFTLTNDDYLDEQGVAQVQVDPRYVWLEAQGGAGAHSGCYDLLRFDGTKLHDEVSGCSSSPGAGGLHDVNGDGTPDAVLDATDYYVFCYACGVRLIDYHVLRWDGQKMVEATLTPLPDAAPAELRTPINQAVALAQAGFWKEAQAAISQTADLTARDQDATWDAGLIRLTAEARAEQARSGAYPLLDNLFYGDYAAVLDTMRPYQPAELFGAETPLIRGTTAEGWEPQVTQQITQTVEAALKLKPDLAAAYFLRGWALHLTDPGNPNVLADIERAAQLDPNEALFKRSLEYLRK